jgi:aryl-alcohol dehydrogenase-like predicted oxidoreductase
VAYEEGIVLFATSHYYGEGNNARMGAKAVQGNPRESYLTMSGVAPNAIDHQAVIFKPGTDVNLSRKDFECSLNTLGMDEIDIFTLPFAAKQESVLFEPLLRVMEDIKKEGKSRCNGIAMHSRKHNATRAAADTGIYDVVLTAYNFRKNNPDQMHSVINLIAGKGIGIIAMKTIAGDYWD